MAVNSLQPNYFNNNESKNIDLKDSYVLGQLQTKQSLSDMRKYFDTLSDIQRNHNAGRIQKIHYN